MLKNNFLKNKKAGSAGDTMSLVVTFIILFLIFFFAFTWTNLIVKGKILNLDSLLPTDLKNTNSVLISPVTLSKNFISSFLELKINNEIKKNEE